MRTLGMFLDRTPLFAGAVLITTPGVSSWLVSCQAFAQAFHIPLSWFGAGKSAVTCY